MKYWLHPEAATEHKQQVAYYEDAQKGLGRRYHTEFRAALSVACATPHRARVIHPPALRRVTLKVFRFDLIYREAGGVVQVLAVAHHRRQPGYWLGRLSKE